MLDRSIKPSPIGRIKFDLPKMNSFSIANFLNVYHVNKNTLPIVQINLIIPAGSIYDPEGKQGISTLTSMLIDEGAGDLSGLEISDRIEGLGSILNINSNKEFTTISLLTLKENLEKSLEIFSLILISPTFEDSEFTRESARLQTQIMQLNDDPSYLASREFQKVIYDKTAYKFPASGTLNSIKNLSLTDVRDFYNKKYSPNGSFLIIVGEIEENESRQLLNKYFENWPNKIITEKKDNTVAKSKKEIVIVDKQDAAQSEIKLGHYSKGRNSEDFYSRTVLNSILGGQFSSRINLNLREDKGFTYGAHSNYSYNRIGSTFTVSTSVKSEHTSNALKEIIFELNSIKTTVTDEELAFAKSYLIRRFPSLFETYSQVATNLSLIPIFNLNKNYFKDYVNKIENVSLTDIHRAADENILLDNLVVVIAGNRSIIEDDLNKLAISYNFKLKNAT